MARISILPSEPRRWRHKPEEHRWLIFGGEFASATFVAFASPIISTANGILNLGFENDSIYKVLNGYNDFSSASTILCSRPPSICKAIMMVCIRQMTMRTTQR